MSRRTRKRKLKRQSMAAGRRQQLYVRDADLEIFRRAKAASRAAGVPFSVHIAQLLKEQQTDGKVH